MNRTQAQSDHIINAFENFKKNVGCVYVQPLTAISPNYTMHEDICVLAEDKRVALIIIPFHKQQTVDGGMEATNPAFRTINQNLLANAPCSVGILVDRGLKTAIEATRSNSANNRNDHNHRILTVVTEADREKQLDEEYVKEFRARTTNNESIIYTGGVVNHGEETVAAIRSIDNSHDLFIVGRGQGTVSPLTAGLTDWSECPELGAIGDLLASSDFAMSASVLVVQQYVGMGTGDPLVTPDSPSQHYEHFNIDLMNRRSQITREQQPSFHSQQ
ncbi:hypothetical protein K7X08_029265 [Anisodus acutangulus]|uniref:Uncharacterized protein n=1 Tax=Anisodus acutangulus TaxID=402998 RepID=A0A9Q1QSR3_9SOLA|nr:hypothetical protein K7X08_029265 [Anisodus acutangulus]